MKKLTATLNMKYGNKLLTEKQLEILKLISKTKSQNKVAEMLNIPPSSVNIQIKRLEKKIGVKLIYSSTSGTILTEDAQYILKHYESTKKEYHTINSLPVDLYVESSAKYYSIMY